MRRPLKPVPLLPSAEIPDTGLISTCELLGSFRLNIKPIVAANRSTLDLWMADGRIPKPTFKLQSGFIAWDASVIKRWVASLEEQDAQ
jgi:predicted DNA-binding transcriptional regulator AlpA